MVYPFGYLWRCGDLSMCASILRFLFFKPHGRCEIVNNLSELLFFLDKTATEKVSLFSRPAYEKTQAYEWYSYFKTGNSSVEDSQRYGRPSTCRTQENEEIIPEAVFVDRRVGRNYWRFLKFSSLYNGF